jgi:ribonuclease VapC
LILDTSAVVAVIRRETGSDDLLERMDDANHVGIGTPTLLETTVVLVRRFGPLGRAGLSRFLEEREVIAIPFGDRHWSAAGEAFIRYGKGRHPAALNFGDCMSYAIARVAGEPLLFVGNDFAQTDIVPAWSSDV